MSNGRYWDLKARGLCVRCGLHPPITKTVCANCREIARQKYHLPETKAKRRAYNSSEPGKKRQKKANTSEKGRMRKRRHLDSEIGKAGVKRTNGSQAYKKSRKKYIEKLKSDPKRWAFEIMQTKLRKMATGVQRNSKTMSEVGALTGDSFRQHIESTFDDGMSWENYGYGSDKWNVGHRIAKALYDKNNPNDLRKCWSAANLFAQWQTENLQLQVTLPSSEQLQQLKDIFPESWKGVPSTVQAIALQKRVRCKNVVVPGWDE